MVCWSSFINLFMSLYFNAILVLTYCYLDQVASKARCPKMTLGWTWAWQPSYLAPACPPHTATSPSPWPLLASVLLGSCWTGTSTLLTCASLLIASEETSTATDSSTQDSEAWSSLANHHHQPQLQKLKIVLSLLIWWIKETLMWVEKDRVVLPILIEKWKWESFLPCWTNFGEEKTDFFK